MERLKKIIMRTEEIRSLLKKENRDFTVEEATEIRTLLDEATELRKAIELKESMDELRGWAGETEDKNIPKENPGQVIVGEDRAAKKPWKSMGEFLGAVIRASHPTAPVRDVRLQETRDAASGMNETVGSEGGFTVGTDYGRELVKETYETGILTKDMMKVTISSNSNRAEMMGVDETSRVTGSRWGGIRVYRKDEVDTVTASKVKFRLIDLKLKDMMALCYLTNDMIRDNSMVESVVRQAVPEELAWTHDYEAISGNGVGQMLGILNSGGLVTVAKEASQAADTVVAENFVKMYSRMPARVRAGAKWYINQELEAQLPMLSIVVGSAGVPLFMPPGGLSATPYGTILGHPVVSLEQCPAPGEVGDVIFGNFGYYVLAGKGETEVAESIHVRFLYDEKVLRFIMRTDGQPIRNSSYTPTNGTLKLGHFVTLAAR